MAPRKRSKPSKLSAGRPPAAKQTQALSSRFTRTTIRTYHELNKRLAAAKSGGDDDAARRVEAELEKLGGLSMYQKASIQGQSKDRGGDSSVVLMDWLQPYHQAISQARPRLRLLEVGALSARNACSRSGLVDVQRIDLNSQGEGIVQQDFMERPLPRDGDERFDVISLSLVLNFVPDAAGRGEMLKRTCCFLDRQRVSSMDGRLRGVCPMLFLVLPAPCTTNSRYFNDERLACIMGSLGYALMQRKETAKLVYSLWQLRDSLVGEMQSFAKTLLNDGPGRNNFTVVLQ